MSLVDLAIVLWVHLVALVTTVFGVILILTAFGQLPSGGSGLYKVVAGVGGFCLIEASRYVEHRFLLRFRKD
jgi:hypothetical protein